MWGVGALAVAPDAIPEGPRRKRLVQAATLTSVMGLAWASSAGGGAPPSHGPAFDHVGLPSAGADEDSMRLASPLPSAWQTADESAAADAESATEVDQTTAPDLKARKREQADDVTARRVARSSDEQAAGIDAGRATRATRAATEARTGKAAGLDRGKAGAAVQAASRGSARAAEAKADRPASKGGKKITAAPDPEAWRTNAIARHDTVTFVQPSPMTVLVGFHEAAMPGAKPLTAAANLDEAHGRHAVPASDRDDPLATAVLPTRARTTDAASAMDIVIPVGQSVYSPVSGTVTEADPYMLYGTHPDHRLVIVPDERPDLRVVILHVTGVRVKPGDKLTAGKSKLADSATPFPFESQIDRFARPLMKQAAPTPHMHVELR